MMFWPRSLSSVSDSELLDRLDLNDRHVGRAVAQDQRRRDVARHVFQHHERAARQLRDRPADIRAFVQIDLDDADALIAVGLDPRDVVHQRRELALVERQNAVLDVFGAHAVVGPDDADDRDVDLGKDVGRHPQEGAGPQQTY